MTPCNPGTPFKHALNVHSDAHIPEETNTRAHFRPTSDPRLVEFHRDIRRLASEIDALKQERLEWKEQLDTESEVRDLVVAHNEY